MRPKVFMIDLMIDFSNRLHRQHRHMPVTRMKSPYRHRLWLYKIAIKQNFLRYLHWVNILNILIILIGDFLSFFEIRSFKRNWIFRVWRLVASQFWRETQFEATRTFIIAARLRRRFALNRKESFLRLFPVSLWRQVIIDQTIWLWKSKITWILFSYKQ